MRDIDARSRRLQAGRTDPLRNPSSRPGSDTSPEKHPPTALTQERLLQGILARDMVRDLSGPSFTYDRRRHCPNRTKPSWRTRVAWNSLIRQSAHLYRKRKHL